MLSLFFREDIPRSFCPRNEVYLPFYVSLEGCAVCVQTPGVPFICLYLGVRVMLEEVC